MTFLETEAIKAPVLYITDKVAAEQFKATLDSLINERNTLLQQRKVVIERANAIPAEIDQLKQELIRTLDNDMRIDLKTSIAKLESEKEDVGKVMAIDVKEVMKDKFAASGVYDLQEQAKKEYVKWVAEINAYSDALDNAYHGSVTKLASFRDFNIYKTTNTKLDDLERYFRK